MILTYIPPHILHWHKQILCYVYTARTYFFLEALQTFRSRWKNCNILFFLSFHPLRRGAEHSMHSRYYLHSWYYMSAPDYLLFYIFPLFLLFFRPRKKYSLKDFYTWPFFPPGFVPAKTSRPYSTPPLGKNGIGNLTVVMLLLRLGKKWISRRSEKCNLKEENRIYNNNPTVQGKNPSEERKRLLLLYY